MLKKGILAIAGIVILLAETFSQKLSHQVLVPAAGVTGGGNIYYSQTIGETSVELIGAYGHILTQGFQQPRMKLMLGTPPQGNGVKVYPNPVIDFLNIELFGETSRSFSLSIINLSGTVVFADDLDYTDKYWDIREIPVSKLARGLYFIRIISKDGLINRSFKVEKM